MQRRLMALGVAVAGGLVWVGCSTQGAPTRADLAMLSGGSAADEPETPGSPVANSRGPAAPAEGQSLRVGGDREIAVTAEPAKDKQDGSVFMLYRAGQHRVDTPLPAGYPPPTPPGAIDLKRYPSVRRAEVSRSDDPDGALFGMVGGKNSAFWPLFRHIESRGIAMTAPVEMDLAADEAGSVKADEWSMAFLYRTADLGPTGEDAKRGVVVRDASPLTVVSMGVSGRNDDARTREVVEALRDWVAQNPKWRIVSGVEGQSSERALYYNDPFTRPQWSEVQVVVEEKKAVQ